MESARKEAFIVHAVTSAEPAQVRPKGRRLCRTSWMKRRWSDAEAGESFGGGPLWLYLFFWYGRCSPGSACWILTIERPQCDSSHDLDPDDRGNPSPGHYVYIRLDDSRFCVRNLSRRTARTVVLVVKIVCRHQRAVSDHFKCDAQARTGTCTRHTARNRIFSKVVLAFSMTVVVSALSAYSGVKSVDPDMEKLMYSLGAKRHQVLPRLSYHGPCPGSSATCGLILPLRWQVPSWASSSLQARASAG